MGGSDLVKIDILQVVVVIILVEVIKFIIVHKRRGARARGTTGSIRSPGEGGGAGRDALVLVG
jgi:hypothetical protein